MSRDKLEDLLGYRPTGIWETRSRFASEALKRIEQGHHFYTYVKNGRLAHISWLAENATSNAIPGLEQGFEFPAGSAVLYGSYTDPGSRRNGLLRTAVQQMLRDVSQAPGIKRVFAAVPVESKAVCRMISRLGFAPVPEGAKRSGEVTNSKVASGSPGRAGE